MAKKENNNARNDFRISNGPVVCHGDANPRSDLGDVMDLPQVYGEKIFLAIARDPRTIFAYWNIDWPAIFGGNRPVDRQVHVRVYKADGTQERSAAVEPMSGSCYLPVSNPGENYRVELGYYQPQDRWNSVAISDDVTMPADSFARDGDVDVATVPFHLSFQRLIDLFRAAKGDAVTEIISRLQRRAVSDEESELLSEDEWTILRAMGLSLDDVRAAQRTFMDRAAGGKLRRRAEAILGVGSTSPGHGFGGSSSG
jgi:Domain of unknown function (DUF4912)